MEFQDYKKQYDELICYKRKEEDILNQNKAEFNREKLESIELNNICNIIKKELDRLNTKYNEYSEAKFNNITNGLNFLLWFLSLIGCIITFFAVGGGAIGLVFSLLIIAGSTLANGIILIIYNFIRHDKPKWITRFWKKDEMFRDLEISIKEKEKELEKNLQLYEISTENLDSLNERISESESYIKDMENQINNLLVSYSTRLFDDSANNNGNIETNPYTKVRRP